MKKTTNSTNFSDLEYHFQDASVPPQYHRSYTITANAKKGHVSVDSYGTILAEEDFEIDEKTWQELQKQASSLQKGRFVSEGATGTKTERIILKDKDKEVFSVLWDSLVEGREKEEKYAEKIASLVPHLGLLLGKELPK